MVFSLFKKKAQKMPEREVMRPKPAFAPTPLLGESSVTPEEAVKAPAPLPDLEFTSDGSSASGKKPATGKSQPKTKEEMALVMSEFERE